MTATSRLPRVRASELVGRGWLNTGGRDLSLADLKGRVVVIDFWTFCCINCLHVLDELRELEERHRDELVIVGVHSPKFAHEADPVALAAAVERYEVHHPVLDDPELVTWGAYTARAWPTLVVVDPEGYVVAQMAGEGHASAIEAIVEELVAEHEARGTLHRGDGPYVPPEPTAGTLRFPAKAVTLPGGNLLVADAGHHSLAELAPDGETLVRRIGSGERGLVDGAPDGSGSSTARFSEPNGLCLVPAGLRASLGYDVLVADTVNHALRGVRLADGAVTTVAGTGEQFMVGGQENVVRDIEPGAPGETGPFDDGASYAARRVRLSSPWDVEWSGALGAFVVAMAGNHTLWSFDPVGGRVRLLAGTMNEGLEDGPGDGAWFAQPSGLAPASGADVPGGLWLADAETSALRLVTPDLSGSPAGSDAPGPDNSEARELSGSRAGSDGPGPDSSAGSGGVTVTTVVGQGLFDFGHRDGPAADALLQHPLGVAALPDGSVVVADTYNGALRRYDPATGEVTTVATGLAEPSDVVVQVADDAGSPAVHLLVVESAAHRLTRVALPADLAGRVLDGGAHRVARPATEVAPGPLRLDVPFVPAPGQKLDDRWGPSTELRVSATPPELLLDGAGDGVDLVRDLVLNPEISEGVLHVTAKAASCDVVPLGPDGEPDPDVFPACHLAQQDWGVPVRVTPTGEAALSLPLRG
ncbi:NHL domain-containing thioredoxin family protein [Isoptericola sp. NEAU-Y5]|uniref:NHL domain-containing thioredoxin family protein n=1 Tax=Isoptericola luteus TaxID=2879484 RepID=A0ABS7ZAB0_9MICO|nr:NHL domain-containing thioredoxin family protein [Isoptericola sp. NEAU-Y5]MCA5891992.1 NHL domain-containing thioredoxin family protein [Isoptericola sp. NEAU-Y5]